MERESKLEILIVDDEVDLSFLLKNTLKKLIYANVDVCHSVKDAVEQLKVKTYDIAFFDYQLKDGTGLDLVEFIHDKIQKLPYIITMSANVNPQEIIKLKEKGTKCFVTKPLSKERVNESLTGFR